jgi:serine/threonine protein kinase
MDALSNALSNGGPASATTSISVVMHQNSSSTPTTGSSSTGISPGTDTHSDGSLAPDLFTEASEYELMQILYQGRSSVVYRAYNHPMQNCVIIKSHQQDYPTASQINKFQKEYEIGKMLDGLPQILRYLNLKKFGRNSSIIMEDFHAISLQAMLSNVRLLHIHSNYTIYEV